MGWEFELPIFQWAANDPGMTNVKVQVGKIPRFRLWLVKLV